MRLSSLHTHSLFCDGRDDVETLCLKAWEKGLDSIGFSSHAPITKKTGFFSEWHLREDRLELYLKTVRAARRRWEGRLRVYLGLEADYIPGLMGPADRDFQDLGLDYIIASVHYAIPPRGAPFTVDGSPEEFAAGIQEGFGGDGEALADHYWSTVEAMIRAGGFDILGHADLIKKNNREDRWFSPESGAYRRRTEAAASLLAQSGTVAEINTGGINRGALKETYPSLPILRLFRKKRVPIIITSDAHRFEDLDGHYGLARETLLAAGYTHAVLFEGKKAQKPVWTPEPL
ncbi:MAG: histidinol-phosphatase [Treponema sp.]|jgi:histidinol-phosphatase (PHP family)|nr:histidinol-phosphatase [Treponema sp.]